MGQLRDTAEIIERLKDVMSKPLGETKVHDYQVADQLGISHFNLASMKRRNSPPLKEVLLFCDRCGLDPRDIVMKSC